MVRPLLLCAFLFAA